MEYKTYKLGDVCKIFGRIGFRGYTTKDLVDSPKDGAISLSPTNIANGTMDLNKCTYISWEKYEESPEIKICPNDILIVKTGNSYGRTAIVRQVQHPMTLNPQFVVLKDIKVNPIYLSYFLKSDEFQKQIYGIVGGSAIPTLSQEDLASLLIRVPNERVQNSISDILDSFDRKIELNKRINDNLEAMAKQLYDYWFVQFDFPNEEGKPYKSSGGEMVWNEKLKRNIPKGWHCGTLLDIAEYTNGLACQKYRPTDENKLPVIKIKEMHDGLSSDTEWVKADIPESVKVYDGDVLFSWSASLEVMLWAYGNGGLNQHIFKVTSKNGYPRSFYFYQLRHYIGVFKQMAEARKTTMGHITQDHLKQSTIALPPNVDIANKLEEKLCPIFDAIVKNNQEIMSLTKQRDELLPLLMNGQATVNYHLYVFSNIQNQSFLCTKKFKTMTDFDSLQFTSVNDLPGVHGAVAFSTKSAEVFREQGEIVPRKLSEKLSYVPWGADDQMPFDIIQLIESDETLSTCQMFNAEVCYGSGLVYDTQWCKSRVQREAEEFALDNDLASYFLGVCQDFKHFGFAVSVILLNESGTKVVRVMRKEACYVRFAPANNEGVIPQVLYANWRNAVQAQDVEVIPLLNPQCLWTDLVAQAKRGKRKFAVVSRVPTPDSTYYPIPYYASLFKGKWYNIKQLIGVAKEAKLKNSAPIKYHIEIAKSFWANIFKAEGITDRIKQQERVNREKDNIISFLTGMENSGKVLFSEFYVSPNGEEQHDVVINKVETGAEGGDWATDIIEAVNMMCFTMRVHSNLVGSVPGKTQTNNSGSDKRELYTIAQALQKPYHDLLFNVHRLIIRFNKWDGAKPDCPFIQLTTLDENKDAKQVSVEPNKNAEP